jgi:hypothetical protein
VICHLKSLSKMLQKIAHNNQADDVGSNTPGDSWA